MKFNLLVKLSAVLAFCITSCKEAKPVAGESDVKLVHLTADGIRVRDASGIDGNIIKDNDAIAELRSAAGSLKLLIDDEVKGKRMYEVLSILVRSTDISIALERVVTSGGSVNSTYEEPKQIIYELPLADGNKMHWQYQSAELIEKAKSDGNPNGFDPNHHINYLRIDYINEGIYIGRERMSIDEIKSRLSKGEFGAGRVAVGIYIGDQDASVGDLLRLMEVVASENCKLYVGLEINSRGNQ